MISEEEPLVEHNNDEHAKDRWHESMKQQKKQEGITVFSPMAD